MESPHLSLIAQFDEDTNQKLAALYGKLLDAGLTGEQTKGIPYHFTLGSFALEHKDKVLARTQAICLGTKIIDTNLVHIGLFGQRVLFLAPSMNIELFSLYKSLVPDESTNGHHNWVAHATLLIDTPENISAATTIIAQHFTPLSARIESIGAYEFFPKKFVAEYQLAL